MKILKIALNLLVPCAVVFLVSFVEKKHRKISCTGIEVKTSSSKTHFVSPHDIEVRIGDMGMRVIGEELGYSDLNKIERAIKDIPYIDEVEVFKTIDGVIKVSVSERVPLIRLINKDGSGCYVDVNGNLMPLHQKYTAYTMVVNGELKEPVSGTTVGEIKDSQEMSNKYLLDEIFDIAEYISNDEFLRALVVQLYVNKDNEFEIIPRIGDYNIVLGRAEGFEEKFNKLKLFCQKQLDGIDLNKYNTINLQYKDQVVCTKK